jgi:hypothetical protein
MHASSKAIVPSAPGKRQGFRSGLNSDHSIPTNFPFVAPFEALVFVKFDKIRYFLVFLDINSRCVVFPESSAALAKAVLIY